MKTLVKKMSSFGVLKVQMFFGALVMLAALIGLPVAIAVQDATLLLNPYVLGVVVIGMVMFGSFAYFLFMRPYRLYKKSPTVLAETDGQYVYVYGKKKAKIPVSAFENAVVTYHLPFLYSKELIATLLTFFFSQQYGDLILDVPGYGSYKLCFVAHVKKTSAELLSFLNEAVRRTL